MPLHYRRKKMDKYARMAENRKRAEEGFKGTGRYVFQNNTPGDLILPKMTHEGIRVVNKGKQFEGDSYFISMVKTNQLRLIKELDSPERTAEMEKKLIVDQPDRVTAQGTVEHVIPAEKAKTLTENTPAKAAKPQPDVLLTEDPMDGVEILLN